jgi:acetyl esterase/lipase
VIPQSKKRNVDFMHNPIYQLLTIMKTANYFLITIAFVASSFLSSCSELTSVEPLPEGSGSATTEERVSAQSTTQEEPNSPQEPTMGQLLTAGNITSYTVEKNRSYGPDKLQNYDLYRPVGTGESVPSVSVVLIHGGGWSLLDKSFLDPVVEEFKKRTVNVTIFNINHRLAGSPGVNFPQIMEDLDLFFEHQQSLKSELNLNDDVVLWGYSSGGHLALTYAYKRKKRFIKSVAAVAAPADLTQPSIYNGIVDDKNRNLTALLLGGTYDQKPEAYQDASPIFEVDGNSVPTVLFYGDNDQIVDDQNQGERLHTALKGRNVKTRFHAVSDATHEMHGKMPGIVNNTINFWKTLN